MQELRDAMKDPVAMPYAISMLGEEHLKAGQVDAALGELEQAVHLLPQAGKPLQPGLTRFTLRDKPSAA